MNDKTKRLFAEKLVALATKLKGNDELPPTNRSVGLLVNGKQLCLGGEDADKFGEITGSLLQEGNWNDKFSETYVGNLVRDLLGKLYGDNNSDKAVQGLDEMQAEYEAFQKSYTAFVPLFGIVMGLPELRIGRVSIKSMTSDEFQRRRMTKAAAQYFPQVVASFENAVVAEVSAIAEPDRAGEIGLDETRRAMDVLRYALSFVAPAYYKRFGMNVGISGESPEGEIMAVVLPSLDENSISLRGSGVGPMLPLTINNDTLQILRECGVEDVSAILTKPVSSLSDFERVLLRAIHWFGNALAQPQPENELLSLVTCLEVFLTPRDGNPIGAAIAEGVALLLETTLERRKTLKKRVKELYGKRSGVSHGGEKAVLESDLAELREIVRKMIRRMISLNTTVPTQKRLLELIEDQKLGGSENMEEKK